MRNSPPNSRAEALGRGPWAQGWRVRESDPHSDEGTRSSGWLRAENYPVTKVTTRVPFQSLESGRYHFAQPFNAMGAATLNVINL